MGRPRYGRDARRAIRAGIGIAAARGDDMVTSEHLLLGVADEAGPGALVLHRLGLDVDRLRSVVDGRIAARGGDPDGPDPDALGSLGIDLDWVRDRGRLAHGRTQPRRRGRPRLSREARVAIEAAVPVAGDRRVRTITSAHLLAGLAVSRPSRVRALLQDLDVDPTEVLRVVGEIGHDA